MNWRTDEPPATGLLPLPLTSPIQLGRDAQSFEMRSMDLKVRVRPERLIVWGTGLGVACSELQLWIGGEAPPGFVPAGIFDRAAFGVRLNVSKSIEVGRPFIVKGEWRPPRRPVYKRRHRAWRGCWWVTHTKPVPDSISAYLLVRADP